MSTRKFPYAMETRVSGEICSLAQEEETEISGWPLITGLIVTHIAKNNGRHEKVILASPAPDVCKSNILMGFDSVLSGWNPSTEDGSSIFFAFNILHLFILFALEKKKHLTRVSLTEKRFFVLSGITFFCHRHRLFLAVALLLAKCWSSTYPLLDILTDGPSELLFHVDVDLYPNIFITF